jgi:hypothetical protein
MLGMIRLLNFTMLPQSRQHSPLITTGALRLSIPRLISLLILINGPRTLAPLLKHSLKGRLLAMPLSFILPTMMGIALFVQSADGGSLLPVASSVSWPV